MDEFATTLSQKWEEIDLAQPAQVLHWSRKLGVSEPELRSAIASAGHSIAAVGRHFGKRVTGSVGRTRRGPPVMFSDDADARRLCVLMEGLDEAVYVRSGLRDEIDFLTDKITVAICKGWIKLEYAPPESAYVAIPAIDNPLYVQALLYWRIRLETTIPRLLESRARLGDGSSIEDAQRMFKRIDLEERTSRTDFSEVPPAP